MQLAVDLHLWYTMRLASTRESNDQIRDARMAAIEDNLIVLGWSTLEIAAIKTDKRVREAKVLTERTWNTLCVLFLVKLPLKSRRLPRLEPLLVRRAESRFELIT